MRKITQKILGSLLIFLLTVVLSPQVFAEEPAWSSLAIYPPQVHLQTASDYQGIIVVATRDDGVTLDVTSEAKLALSDKSAHIEGQTLRPVSDGNAKLTATFNTLTATAAISVTKVAEHRPISFMTDCMPTFARAGCNTGSCHGSASGKDGFRLSLFGYDPRGDYFRITREEATRRINLAIPSDSLLLEKSVGKVQHTGGKLFGTDSKYYQTMHQWLSDGAKLDADTAPTVTSLSLYPPAAVMEGDGAVQQFIAVAGYSDGTTRDVTDLTKFSTNNATCAPIEPLGKVTAKARGESFIMARFDVHNVGSQVLTLPKEVQYNKPTEKPANYIDELVGAKLHKLRIEPSNLCTDEEFLRRVTIDIAGMLPTPEEHTTFLADKSADKRAKKIDELLSRKEFAEIWAMKWSELLMVKTVANVIEYKPMFLYSSWLTQQIANDVPLDKIVRDILGASGGTFSEPATNFYQIERDVKKTAENVAQVFMGTRIQCAQCHNHIFDRWTMDDYYSFNAFFSQIGRKQAEDYRETIIFNRGNGEVQNPVSKKTMAPKFLGGATPDVKGKDRRVIFAEWLTAPDNPFFGPSVANRIWAHFNGPGIVSPVDDFRVSNPASNPELLDALGKKLVEYKYDFKKVVRDICNSNTYQRSTDTNGTNEADLRNYSHATVRRVQAEMLLDCISQITDTKDKFRGLPIGARAVQIADGNTSNYFLSTFGRAKRESVCSCEVDTQPSLSQSLHLINGTTVENKIRQGKTIEKLLDAGKSNQEVIENLYVRSLSRMPSKAEIEQLLKLCGDKKRPIAELQDIYWAILNAREFMFNH